MKAIKYNDNDYIVSFICKDVDYRFIGDICKFYNSYGDFIIGLAINTLIVVLNEDNHFYTLKKLNDDILNIIKLHGSYYDW